MFADALGSEDAETELRYYCGGHGYAQFWNALFDALNVQRQSHNCAFGTLFAVLVRS